jgi:uncharacterized coiled-coil DUF342 family protein
VIRLYLRGLRVEPPEVGNHPTATWSLIMNKARRAYIQDLVNQLGSLQGQIEEVRDAEQEYYDNMPESFQNGDKGNKAQEALNNLENAANNVGEAISELEAAMED